MALRWSHHHSHNFIEKYGKVTGQCYSETNVIWTISQQTEADVSWTWLYCTTQTATPLRFALPAAASLIQQVTTGHHYCDGTEHTTMNCTSCMDSLALVSHPLPSDATASQLAPQCYVLFVCHRRWKLIPLTTTLGTRVFRLTVYGLIYKFKFIKSLESNSTLMALYNQQTFIIAVFFSTAAVCLCESECHKVW